MLKASVPKHAMHVFVDRPTISFVFVVHAQDAQPTAPSAKTAITAIFEGKMGNLTLNLSSSDLAFDTTVRVFA